jgi:hypothetical protein
MIGAEIRAWLEPAARIDVDHGEEWMPRHFGLKAMSMAQRSESIRLPDAAPALAVSSVTSPSLSPSEAPEAKLSSPDLSLPFAPASWRGCHGRRSVSAE